MALIRQIYVPQKDVWLVRVNLRCLSNFLIRAATLDFSTYHIFKSTLNTNALVFSSALGLVFGLSIPLLPCFIYEQKEGSGLTNHVGKLR